MTNKEYYEENREYISQAHRALYHYDEEYKEYTKHNSMKRYEAIQKNRDLKLIYNEKRKLYMREYRARKRNQL